VQGATIFNINLNVNVLTGPGNIGNDNVNPNGVSGSSEQRLVIAKCVCPRQLVDDKPHLTPCITSGPTISQEVSKTLLQEAITEKNGRDSGGAGSQKLPPDGHMC